MTVSDNEHGHEGGQNNLRNMDVSVLMGALGAIVFLASAAIGLVAVFKLLETEGTTHTQHLRLIDVSFRIGAIGLLVGFLAGRKSPFVVTFGILVVAALIVTPKELTRMVLLVSGSDKRIEHYFSSSARGSDYNGRVRYLAGQIVSDLRTNDVLLTNDKNLEDMPEGTVPYSSEDISDYVACLIEEERKQVSLERLEITGTQKVFSAVASDDFQAFLYRNKEEDQLLPDLLALRSSGLIDFDYQHYEDAELTQYGMEVMQYLDAEGGSQCRFGEVNTGLFTERSRGNCPENLEGIARVTLDSRTRFEISLDPQPYLLEVDDDQASVEVMIVGDAERAVDPYLRVLRYQGSGSCWTIGENDDHFMVSGRDELNPLDSHFQSELSVGSYIIWASAFGEFSEGEAEIVVTTTPSEPGSAATENLFDDSESLSGPVIPLETEPDSF